MGEKLRVGFYVGILLSEIVFISVGIALYITGRKDFSEVRVSKRYENRLREPCIEKSSSNYDKPELIDLGLILCSMGGFGLVLNACVCLNGMYSCIPCSFCKFTQVEPSPRSGHQHARHTSYMTSDTSRHLGTSVDPPAPTDFDDGLPSYDEIFPPKAEF